MRKILALMSVVSFSLLASPALADWHGQPGSKAYREWQRRAGSPAHQASVRASQRVWHDRNNLGSFGFRQKYHTSNVSAVAARVGYSAFMQTLCRGLRRR